jgi:hypothetical protein
MTFVRARAAAEDKSDANFPRNKKLAENLLSATFLRLQRDQHHMGFDFLFMNL